MINKAIRTLVIREAGEEVWENLKTQDRWITDPLFQSLPWRENN